MLTKNISLSSLSILIVLAASAGAVAPSNNNVETFVEVGVIVDIQNFYDAAKDQAASYQPVGGGQGRQAFVTASGVYAFLETPSNETHLKNIAPGTAVQVTGKLLTNGTLLHIDGMTPVEDGRVDLASYKMAKGKSVELTGSNLCQCGLDVGELPHSCQLGHRHHLQGDDGKIYHYLQYGDAQKAYLGQGSHFKNVSVKAIELPGQYLLVSDVSVQ